MKQLLNQTDRELLAQLVGKRLVSVFSANLSPNLYTDYIFIETDGATVEILGDIFGADPDGFLDDYCFWRISIPTKNVIVEELQSTEKVLLHERELIRSIELVTQTVSQRAGEVTNWSFTSDVALIFHLESGALMVSRDHLQTEVMKITFFDINEEVPNPDCANYFADAGDARIEENYTRRLLVA